MGSNDPSYHFSVICLFILAAMLLGCDNTIDPFEEEKGLYSIYGVFDLHKDINYIRIKDLNRTLRENCNNDIDATVTVKNIDENKTETLQDSLIAFDSVYTHNFRTTLAINPDTRYELTVERSDNKSMDATATTPHIADVDWGPTDEYCNTPIEITFDPVHDPRDLELSVGFDYDNIRYWANPDANHFEGDIVTFRFAPINILLMVFNPPGPDTETIECHQLDNENLYVEYIHYGPDFGDDNLNILDSQDGSIKFGALYEDSFSFTIDTTNVCPPLC